MSEKPILFNTEMVRAILDGRKTQTRRLVKNLPLEEPYATVDEGDLWVSAEDGDWYRAEAFSPIKPGDILWVRERFAVDDEGQYHYYADTNYIEPLSWKPSIHMPREAARIFLRVTGVWCERLDDMTEDDAISEGFTDSPAGTDSPLERFAELWDKTIKRADRDRYGWYGNPWVWVIEFERVERSYTKR